MGVGGPFELDRLRFGSGACTIGGDEGRAGGGACGTSGLT